MMNTLHVSFQVRLSCVGEATLVTYQVVGGIALKKKMENYFKSWEKQRSIPTFAIPPPTMDMEMPQDLEVNIPEVKSKDD